MGGPAATVIERPPAGRALAVRPLERPEAPAAAAMLLRTNDGLPVEELERDLRENQERWPSLQLGAFSPDGELWGVIAGRLDLRVPALGWSDDIVLAAA